jgi:hypothetical protein
MNLFVFINPPSEHLLGWLHLYPAFFEFKVSEDKS